jgi:NhaP-type Na+/H+ or K+/H+ antiporter
MRMRAQERSALPPAQPRSRREVVLTNAAFLVFYALIVIGGVVCWLIGHSPLTLAVGAVVGLAVTPALLLLAGGLGLVRRSAARRR